MGRAWVSLVAVALLGACSGSAERVAASAQLQKGWGVASYDLTRGEQRVTVDFFDPTGGFAGGLEAWLTLRERVVLFQVNGVRFVHDDDGTHDVVTLGVEEGTMSAGEVPGAGVILLEPAIQAALADEIGIQLLIESPRAAN